MTIKFKRFGKLPWWFPFNVKDLKKGDAVYTIIKYEYLKSVWKLETLDDNKARLTEREGYWGGRPRDVSITIITGEEINHSGPPTRNWRWIEGKSGNKET